MIAVTENTKWEELVEHFKTMGKITQIPNPTTQCREVLAISNESAMTIVKMIRECFLKGVDMKPVIKKIREHASNNGILGLGTHPLSFMRSDQELEYYMADIIFGGPSTHISFIDYTGRLDRCGMPCDLTVWAIHVWTEFSELLRMVHLGLHPDINNTVRDISILRSEVSNHRDLVSRIEQRQSTLVTDMNEINPVLLAHGRDLTGIRSIIESVVVASDLIANRIDKIEEDTEGRFDMTHELVNNRLVTLEHYSDTHASNLVEKDRSFTRKIDFLQRYVNEQIARIEDKEQKLQSAYLARLNNLEDELMIHAEILQKSQQYPMWAVALAILVKCSMIAMAVVYIVM